MLNYAPRADEELWPCATASEPHRPGTMAASRTGSMLRTISTVIRTAFERRKAVAELASLDDRLLKDMGLTRGEIREAVADIRIAPGSMTEDRQ